MCKTRRWLRIQTLMNCGKGPIHGFIGWTKNISTVWNSYFQISIIIFAGIGIHVDVRHGRGHILYKLHGWVQWPFEHRWRHVFVVGANGTSTSVHRQSTEANGEEDVTAGKLHLHQWTHAWEAKNELSWSRASTFIEHACIFHENVCRKMRNGNGQISWRDRIITINYGR